MSNPTDRNHQSGNGPADPHCLEAERLRLEQQVRELAAENERLKRELSERSAKCQEYRSIARAHMIEDWKSITEEDLRNAVPTGPWFTELLGRLEESGRSVND